MGIKLLLFKFLYGIFFIASFGVSHAIIINGYYHKNIHENAFYIHSNTVRKQEQYNKTYYTKAKKKEEMLKLCVPWNWPPSIDREQTL